MHALSLRDEVFLLAHDDRGKPIIGDAALAAGLAGATLIDLLLSNRVAVLDGRLDVINPAATGDPETDATLAVIAANTAPSGPRAWVNWISHGAYDRIADALVTKGIVERTTVRRLGLVPAQRSMPTTDEDLVRVRSRVRFAVH